MTREKEKTTNPTFEERLKHALEVHGFPLEIETHQKLLSNDWKADAESVFIDPDTEKTRRNDFIAWKIREIESSFFSKVDISLIIECKKRTNSVWVFYGEGTNPIVPEDISSLIDFTSFAIITLNEKWTDGWHASAVKKILHPPHQLQSRNHKVAISGHEIRVETIQEWNKRRGKENQVEEGNQRRKGLLT